MIQPTQFKRYPETCFMLHPSGKIQGRNNRAELFLDSAGNISDNGKEYNGVKMFQELFPELKPFGRWNASAKRYSIKMLVE